MNRPTAIVYVDGLNLYKQLLENHPEYRWLNPYRMCEILLPTHEIKLIRYFTSRVKPGLRDVGGPVRQQLYLRALSSLESKITITFGKMIRRDRKYPASPISKDSKGDVVLVKVQTTEEKGSDVALASYMVLDAARKEADLYVLVSNDSDFAPTLHILKNQLGANLALFSPVERPSASLLISQHLMVKVIRNSVLRGSQFPEFIEQGGSVIRRPEKWT